MCIRETCVQIAIKLPLEGRAFRRGQRRTAHMVKTTSRPFVRFDVLPMLPESRYQAWKFHVSPALMETAPLGCGVLVRSSCNENAPPASAC